MNYAIHFIGEHPEIVRTRRLITRVAESPTRTVLIYGETGTGKGLVARMIHGQSSRAGASFIDVNCAAIPSNLAESELFGYERGAFTGALSKKTGLVEAASGGSLFLDEIRELEPALQAKLLSLLDTQEFRRVGAISSKRVDVRFIAATNRILSAEVYAGRFRDDLYFRLQVVAINIPPLRDRGEDVMLLADHFMEKFSLLYRNTVQKIEPEVRELFLTYDWPGNVRELENLLERIYIMEDESTIKLKHIPPRILREVNADSGGYRRVSDSDSATQLTAANDEAGCGLDFHARTHAFQRRIVSQALANNHTITQAAESLGISRHALRHQMKKLALCE